MFIMATLIVFYIRSSLVILLVEPSIIRLEATSVVEVLLLFPTIILIHFVRPWFTLPLNIVELLVCVILFIVVILAVFIKIAITVRKAFELSFLLLFGEFSFVILFVVDLNEAGKSFIGSDTTFTLKDIDHDAV